MNQIGELIRRLRKANGLTQSDLANQYGMSRATPRRISRPTIDELKKAGYHG
jgi:transcriptional regulator with XRE-family HTH domain